MGHLDPKWNEAKAPWKPGHNLRVVQAGGGLHRWLLRPGAFLHVVAPEIYHSTWRRMAGYGIHGREAATAASN